MAFNQLKKWVGTQLWSTFMTEYNENIDELNRVIDGVNENEAHLADIANLNSSKPLWNGSANSGQLTFSESAYNFTGLVIRTNENPASSGKRGEIYVGSTPFPAAYFPVVFGTEITWMRLECATGNYLEFLSAGNANLHILSIIGVGRKPNTGGV